MAANNEVALPLVRKDLILLYIILKKDECPDALRKSFILAKIEKLLYEDLTIAEIENIEELYRRL
jgi:hypothetical protein